MTYVDRGSNIEVTRADPSYALDGERPHVIDEWQRVPEVWDVVRHAVDQSGGEKGSWILTGSSTPSADRTAHSGAGRIGRVRMHPMMLAERLARSVARNLGQASTLSTLARDVYAIRDDRVPTNDEQQAVSRHLDLLGRLYLVDSVPGWVPSSRSPKRMRTKSRRYFVDPSLVVSLLGMSVGSLLNDWQTFGLVFENLCMRDLDVLARALPGAGAQPLRYYHDDSDLEVDAIIERADRSWAAIEIKLSPDKVEDAATSLIRMRAKLMKDALARTPEPAFLAVLTGTGERAYRRPDGVFVIPVRALGA